MWGVSGGFGQRLARGVAIALALLALLLLLALGRTPSTPVSPPPTADKVEAARRVYQRVRVAQAQPGAHPVRAGWQELGAVAELGGRALGVERAAFERVGERARLTASVPLPLGFWLNGRAYIEAGEDQDLAISGRIGHLPVPGFLAHALFGMSRQLLKMRGASIPPLDQMVSGFELDDQGLAAQLDLPGRSRVFSAMSMLRADAIDAQRVESHYCRLVASQREQPEKGLAAQVRRAFAGGKGTVTDNRAVFVALSLFTAGIDVGALPAGASEIFGRCGRADADPTLLGRADLAKHWAVSAALTSVYGPQASLSLGTWKEVFDSGAGRSGFSLVDLAADRSGTFSAQRGTESELAGAVREWLARVEEAELLPVSALALAEGMTEAQFRSRYASTDSTVFATTVQRIDETLAALTRFGEPAPGI